MRSILYSCALLCLFLSTNLSVNAQCVPTTWHRDWDGDGHGTSYDYELAISSCEQPEGYVSSSDDCNDYNASIHVGAKDICDDQDNDCDGLYDEDAGEKKMYYIDEDYDGYGKEPGQLLTECEARYSWYPLVLVKGDCNNQNASVYPGAPELCDAIDNNCDGEVDEGLRDAEGYNPKPWYYDHDGDGYGFSFFHNVIISCTQPEGYVANNLDCSDWNASVYPGAPEICDYLDNDCDGSVDEDMPTSIYYADQDWDGYGTGPALLLIDCQNINNRWVAKVAGDCDDSNPNINTAATEVCDGIDNNCDGVVDEGFRDVEGYNPLTWYPDQDGDGYGNGYDYNVIRSCTQPEGYVANNSDCDDYDPTTYPGAPEICDGRDNNCNGEYEEGIPLQLYYLDNDGDGYGEEPGYELTECEGAGWPWGTLITIGGDLNDSDPAINPAAIEVCDGVDNNCDGQVDEGFNPQYKIYKDEDQDGYGNDETAVALCDPDIIWEGYVRVGGDCSDWNPDAHPGVLDICDDQDNDCDGEKDEDAEKKFYYLDFDGDGYGQEAHDWLTECQADGIYWFTLNRGDCDDGNAAISPLAMEVCDGIDNNCDGQVDEGFNPTDTYYYDNDLDGYGNDRYTKKLCDPLPHYVAVGGDRNDEDGTIYPGAPELCDGFDNDGNGQRDEGFGELKPYYWDGDHDGYGYGEAILVNDCQISRDGFGQLSPLNGDCRDTDPTSYPGAPELCDAIDNNCNGEIDEGCPISLLTINDIHLMETEAYAELTVSISRPSNKKISVSYTTVEGSAKSKVAKGTIADFVEQKGKVTIPAGELSASIKIPLLNDGIVEGEERFHIQLSKPHNAQVFKEIGYVYIWDASRNYLSKSAAVPDKQTEAAHLTAKVFPNPSNTHFTIRTQGKAGEKISIRIVDALGRVVETRSNVSANGSLVLGHSYRPGMYYAEIMQGSEKVTLRLVKQ